MGFYIVVMLFVIILQEEVEEVLKLQYWMSYASEAQFRLSVSLSVQRSTLSLALKHS